MVTIRGTTGHEEESEQEQYYRRELTRAEYSRFVSLPVKVDGEGAKAVFRDGILELALPKATPSGRRSIPVE